MAARKKAVDVAEVGGARLVTGDRATWTPSTTGTESAYCEKVDTVSDPGNGGCRLPQIITVTDCDYDSADDTYEIRTSNTCEYCAEEIWIPARELTRIETSGALNDLRDLATKVSNETIGYGDLKAKIQDVLAAFTQREQEADANAKGVCSACFTDVEFVGGAWQHADKRVCNPPAVMLA